MVRILFTVQTSTGVCGERKDENVGQLVISFSRLV